MTGVLRPVGPQPARVYWVRRAVVLGALLLVLVVAAVAIGATRGNAAADDGNRGEGEGAGVVAASGEESGDGAAQEPAEGAGGEGAEGDASEPAADTVGPVTCEPSVLTVTLTAEGRSFGAPSAPTFAFAVTNSGDEPCTVDAGSGSQVVTVTSGADRIWSSADCAAEGEERLLLLQPGAQDVVPVAWDRTRSDEGCTGELPAPGAGTYQAVGTMLGATSDPFVFDLT